MTLMISTEKGSVYNNENIFTLKDILDLKIQEHVGEQAFFGDCIGALHDAIDTNKRATITAVDVDKDVHYPFFSSDGYRYAMCLLASKVSHTTNSVMPTAEQMVNVTTGQTVPMEETVMPEPRKEYRPFRTPEEFKDTLNVKELEFITFRKKQIPTVLLHQPNLGYRYCVGDNTIYFIFGDTVLFAADLFDEYEWLDKKGNWLPFGIEVKDE